MTLLEGQHEQQTFEMCRHTISVHRENEGVEWEGFPKLPHLTWNDPLISLELA